MVREIYIRTDDDIRYLSDVLEHSDEYEMLIGKIFMILKTRKGEVLGDSGFGMSLEDRLFTFDLDENSIRREIINQINFYAPESTNFNLEVEIKRLRGTVRDAVVIDIILDGRKVLGVLVK